MSEENVETSISRRPLRDEVLVRLPFLVDLAAAAVFRLHPGSRIRRRVVKLAFRTAWEANARRDFEPSRLLYERNAEVFLFGAEGLGLAGRYSGERGWTQFIGDIMENFGETRWSTQRIRDAGDRLVADVALTGSGKASGAPVKESIATVYYLSPRGKVARQDVFWRPDSWNLALSAAGLSE